MTKFGSRKYDLRGQRFDRLLVVDESNEKRQRRTAWVCRCDCGNEKLVSQASLLHKQTRSCGCLKLDRFLKYGVGVPARGLSVEYKAWKSIVDRTTKKSCENYSRYGARGIMMCDLWLNGDEFKPGFEHFLEHVSKLPLDGNSIDRKNNDGNYEPGNVRWATAKTQSRNRSSNVVLTIDDRSQSVAAWCEELGISPFLVYGRLKRRWSSHEALGLKPRIGSVIGRPKGVKDTKPRAGRVSLGP